MEKLIDDIALKLYQVKHPGVVNFKSLHSHKQDEYRTKAREIIAMMPFEKLISKMFDLRESVNIEDEETANSIFRCCDEMESLIPTKQDDNCKCQSCGKDFKMDLLIDNEKWEIIKPEGRPHGAGLLCPHCIIEKIISHEGNCAYRLIVLEEPPPDEPDSITVLIKALGLAVDTVNHLNIEGKQTSNYYIKQATEEIRNEI